MADITLHTSNDAGVTCVSNAFIDEYMKDANGEFVKIYLYLLRLLGQDELDIDISLLAEKLDHTERDVKRALSYWEKCKLISLEYNSSDELTGICFLEPSGNSNTCSSQVNENKNYEHQGRSPLPKRQEYSISQMNHFKEDDDMDDLLFVIEKYLGHNLTVSDLNYIIYWTADLHFSTELVTYLVEYCIDKGHPSIKYMDRIALDWASNNISSVEEAKEDTIQHSDAYYNICKSFGINNRGLIKSELEYVQKWKRLGLNADVIEEACRRTIVNTNKPNFEYADKIIDNWVNHKVKTLDDVKVIDEEYKKKFKNTSVRNTKTVTPNNRFNNFDSRDYDFDDLEKTLVNKK